MSTASFAGTTLAAATAEMGPPAAVFSPRAVRGAVVYAWVRGEEVLYVGSSRSIRRPICVTEHHRLAGIVDGDEVLIWNAPSLATARSLEREMIETLNPTLNGTATLTGGSMGATTCLRLSVSLVRRMKVYCAQNGLKIQDFVTEVLDEYLKKRGA